MATRATHTHSQVTKVTHTHKHSYTRRPAEPGGSAYGVGVVGRSLSGVARGQRALLEADDAVGDVRGVRVDRRHADRREVVREVAPRVELAVLGAVAAAFLVAGTPGDIRRRR